MNELGDTLATLQRRNDRWQTQYELLDSQANELEGQRETWAARAALQDEALAVLQRLEETWRGHYEGAIAALGGQGVNSVFPDDTYEVVLETSIKRGVANLDIILVKNGERVRIKGGSGGSVVQVLAYLLRYFMTTSQSPSWRRMEALDEPFSMVSSAQRPALCQLVREITDRLEFQLFLSSHEDELLDAADVAYMVHLGGKVELIKSPEGERT